MGGGVSSWQIIIVLPRHVDNVACCMSPFNLRLITSILLACRLRANIECQSIHYFVTYSHALL